MAGRTLALARVYVAVFLAAGAVVLSMQPVEAHAQLRSTFPADSETSVGQIDRVSLTFNEGIDTPSAGVRVFDAQGRRVDLGNAQSLEQDPQTIVVSIGDDENLTGTYIVTWRASSADGHPVSGAFNFSVDEALVVNASLAAELFGDSGVVGVGILAAVLRLLYSGAVLALFGAAVFARRVAGANLTSGDDLLVRRLAQLVALSSLAAIPVQAVATTGFVSGAVSPEALVGVVTHPFGLAALVRALAATVFLLRPAGGMWLAGLAALTLVLEGHTLTESPVVILVTADVVHVLAGGIWLGGIVLLVRLAGGGWDDRAHARVTIRSFSSLALWAMMAVVAAGIAMTFVLARTPRTLPDTTWGITWIVKVAIVVVIVLIAAYNRLRLLPALEHEHEPVREAAWSQLRTTIRMEAIAAVAVVAVGALLVGLQPAAAAAGITGAFVDNREVEISADTYRVEIVVDPNRAGLNEMHMYVLSETGQPVREADVRLALRQVERDIGPLERVPEPAGPGHWILTGGELSIAGAWEAAVTVGLGSFDEATASFDFVVN